MNTTQQTFFKRALILVAAAFIAASALLGFQTELEHHLGNLGYLGLIVLIMVPLMVAGYNNTISALKATHLIIWGVHRDAIGAVKYQVRSKNR